MQTTSYIRCFHRFIQQLQNFDRLDIHFETADSQVLDKSRPRVMDPTNPYNNLASNWDLKSIQLLKDYANESERRLKALADARLANLDQLFEPQPVYRVDISELYKYDSTTRSQWLVGIVTFSSLPDLKVRNEKFHKELWAFSEILKQYFQCTIFAASASSSDENYVKAAIHNTIARQVCNSDLTWSPVRGEDHEDFDVTFTIPFSNQKAIRVSFRL